DYLIAVSTLVHIALTFGPIDVMATMAPMTIKPQTRPHSRVSVPCSSRTSLARMAFIKPSPFEMEMHALAGISRFDDQHGHSTSKTMHQYPPSFMLHRAFEQNLRGRFFFVRSVVPNHRSECEMLSFIP